MTRSGRRGLGGDPGQPAAGHRTGCCARRRSIRARRGDLRDRDHRCGGALLLAGAAGLDRGCVRPGPDATVDPIGQRRRRRALVPRARRERGGRDQRARGVRRTDRGVGDRRDVRVRDGTPYDDRRSDPGRGLDGRPASGTPRRAASRGRRAGSDRPRDGCAGSRPRTDRGGGRTQRARRRGLRARARRRSPARGARASRSRARRVAPDRGDAQPLRCTGVRGDAAERPVLQRGARRHGRRARADRGAAMAAGSRARRSMSTRRSRCPHRRPCGRCPT